ncbi:hypothetical protein KY285_017860 [Solanum tuberosum]|nr:hypothetical protein KY284_017855 [Solanum tuberosum]KAH0703582.1 hypothetical protein KY285_017860 [Solanum tuberosum]
MSSSLNSLYYRTTKVEEIEKKTERQMEYFTREIQRPNSTNMWKPAPAPKKPSEDINESAENFIKKYKQQLLLQRLESMENYEQMLKRGT